jgi:hypothetical protein
VGRISPEIKWLRRAEEKQLREWQDKVRAKEAEAKRDRDYYDTSQWGRVEQDDLHELIRRAEAEALQRTRREEVARRFDAGEWIDEDPNIALNVKDGEMVERVWDAASDTHRIRKIPRGGFRGEPDYSEAAYLAHNAVKATVHKAGHFPIQWMTEAFERSEQCDALITVNLEKEGVTVIGESGDEYMTHTLAWTMMEKAETNPIILAIDAVEKKLKTLGRLKERVGQ